MQRPDERPSKEDPTAKVTDGSTARGPGKVPRDQAGSPNRSTLHQAGGSPLRRDRVGTAGCGDHQREGRGRPSSSATSRCPRPGRSWRPTSWRRSTSAASSGTPEREHSVRQLIDRVVKTAARWGREGELLRQQGGRRGVRGRADPPARAPDGLVQLAGLVQLRRRGAPAGLGLFHQLRRRHDGFDPRPGQDRGNAVQVRLGHRLQPLADPLQPGEPGRRRHRLGSGLVHEGLRRLRRRDQVGRQDPPRGQDGHPQRRPSRHRGVHQLQGRTRRRRPGR